MTAPSARVPNADEVAFWNGRAGEKWVQYQEIQDRMLRPYGVAAIRAAALGPGERAIDVGCGCGDSTLEIARTVAPDGEALGIDVSAVMVARARERAAGLPEPRPRFVIADAQLYRFADGEADAVLSRFGVMFFDDPVAAFANLRSALRPGGRLSFACWQTLEANPWVKIVLDLTSRRVHVDPPGQGATGPFAFADPARVENILSEAGFADVGIEACAPALEMGRSLDEAVKHTMQLTPAAGALAEAGPEVRAAVAEDLAVALAPFASGEGVCVPSGGWIVTARRP